VEYASGIARQMVGRRGMSPAIEECYEQALATLRGSRDRLDRLARALLDRETPEEDEAYAAAGISPGRPPAAIARGEAPGATTAPGNPLAAAQAGADHIASAPSR
jgi:cell division protease FtsH